MSTEHQSRVHFDWTINLGHVINLVVLGVGIVLAYASMEKRVSLIEVTQLAAEQRAAKFVPIIEKLEKTLDRLGDRLSDFPLHRHIDKSIVYPGSTRSGEVRPQALHRNNAERR